MKKYLGFVFAGALALATGAYGANQAQNTNTNQHNKATSGSTEKVQDTKTTTDSGTKKLSTDTLMGKVEEYQARKWIKVSTPGKTEGSRTVDLSGNNLTANVPSDIKVGDWVSVSEKTDNNGHKTVTVERSKHAARSRSR